MRRANAPSGRDAGNIVERVAAPSLASTARTKRVTADPTKEYVAGGTNVLAANFLRSLSVNIDDLSIEFGDDIYERMMLDAQVSSSVETLKGDVLASGVRMVPTIQKGAAGFDRAQRIADFCDLALTSMEVSLTETLYDMLDALPFGYRVAEQVYHIPDFGPLKGCLVPRYLKPKPRRATAFVVDSMNNVQGFLGAIPGQFSPLMMGSMIPDPAAPNFLPRSKFAVLTFRKRNGDPRGRSALRAAYFPWWMKQQGYPAWLKFMALFAVPGLIGNVAPKATNTVLNDQITGEPQYDSHGAIRTVTPEEAMLSAMVNFINAGCIALPAEAKVAPLQVGGADAPFIPTSEWCDQQISIAITGQTLSGNEGKHMSRAAATVHQDTKGVTVQQAKEAVQNMIRNDILTPIVRMNFGPDAVPLTPFVSLAETEQHDFATEAVAVSGLWDKGYLSPSQVPEIDARLGLPQRSNEDMERLNAEAVAKTEAAVNPPAPPDPQAKTGPDDKDPAKFDDGGGHWITSNGGHIFIPDKTESGASKSAAAPPAASGGKKDLSDEEKAAEAKVKAERSERVMGKLPKIAAGVPKMRDAIAADLAKDGLTKERVGAVVAAIMDATTMRVGSEKYATKSARGEIEEGSKTQDSFGASSLRKNHVTVTGDTVNFSFPGKSRKDWERSITDAALAKAVTELLAAPGDRLMQHQDAKGDFRPFTETHAGEYLAPHGLTPKNLRTYHASKMAAEILQSAPHPKNGAEAEAKIKEVAVSVSKHLGNTPAIARASYINPVIFEDYKARIGKG